MKTANTIAKRFFSVLLALAITLGAFGAGMLTASAEDLPVLQFGETFEGVCSDLNSSYSEIEDSIFLGDYMPGDVNGDRNISAEDARLALRKAVNLEDYEEGSIEFLSCDVDFDGQVRASDARMILRAAVQLEDTSLWKTIDSDSDDIPDYLELYYGTDKTKADTDNDKFTDLFELTILGTSPVLADSDNDGINDYDADNDKDGLTNGYEFERKLDPAIADTDFDGLNDGDELNLYKTDPLKDDSDEDGVSDGWEIEHNYDPLSFDAIVTTTASCTKNGLTAKASVDVFGEQAESMTITPIENNTFLNESVPGIIGRAFDFNISGNFGLATISFEFDESLLSEPNFNPVIYYFNKETQLLEPLTTTVEINTATAKTTHFSIYVLIDNGQFLINESSDKIDLTTDSGNDSNLDGISDYITSLLCSGKIKTSTGQRVFENHTYEEIQANDDIDGDGIKNGDEIIISSAKKRPEDVSEYNGHYYKCFYESQVSWTSAKEKCEQMGGHLVTITDDAEQQFILSIKNSSARLWIGASRYTGDKWYWVTGEDFDYTNWGTGEPNNSGAVKPNENCVSIWPSEWNDLNDLNYYEQEGYICEWEDTSAIYTQDYGLDNYVTKNSSPTDSDTDHDGLPDGSDAEPLAWNVCDRDLGIFASIAYETESNYTNKSIVGRKEDKQETENDKGDKYYFLDYASAEEVYDYWNIIDWSGEIWANLATHFSATTFKNDSSNSIVIAYRGTDGELGEWVNNIVGYGLFNSHSEEGLAKGYAKKIAARFPECNIYITGHSLGGYLSQFGAFEIISEYPSISLKKVVYFNGMGLNFNIKSNNDKYQYNDAVITSLKKYYNGKRDSSANLISYNINGDIISALGTHSGLTCRFNATDAAILNHQEKGGGTIKDFLSKKVAGWLGVTYWYDYYGCTSIIQYFWITHESDSFFYYLTQGTRPYAS